MKLGWMQARGKPGERSGGGNIGTTGGSGLQGVTFSGNMA